MSDDQPGASDADHSGVPLLEQPEQESTTLPSPDPAPALRSSSSATPDLDEDRHWHSSPAEKSSNDDGEDHSISTKSTESWISLWLWELLYIAISVGCVAINFAVLMSIDGKPLTSWTVLNVKITPNALISIFSTLSKSSILHPVAEGISQLKWIFFQRNAYPLSYIEVFDNASRGPLGALNSLWQLKVRAALTSIGALITILALAIDPFTQQILSYPTQSVKTMNMTTSIQIAKELTYNDKIDQHLLQGIFAPGTLNRSSCPTLHCKWPSFKNLGICSKCTNTTSLEDVDCSKKSSDRAKCTIKAISDMEFNVDYELINGSSFWWGEDGTWTVNYGWYVGVDAIPSQGNGYRERSFIEPSGVIANLTFLQLQWGQMNDGQPPNPEANVTTCTISLCEQSYAPSHFVNGTLAGFASSSEPLVFGACHFYPLAADSHLERWPAGKCPGVPLSQNSSVQQWTPSSLAASDVDVYRVDLLTPKEIADRFTAIFMDQTFEYYQTTGIVLSGTLTAALSSGFNFSVPQLGDAIATGLSSYVRRNPYNSELSGDVLLSMVFVKVRWGWFGYPVALVLLAVTFWTATVVFSSGEQKLIWKSSSLALLFHGPKGWPVEDLQAARLRDMNKAAANMRARLSRDGQGNISLVRS